MKKLNYRYIARVVLEAETPLFIGSGESSLLQDALVQKDNHGFPMILGTSLTGVLRHAIEDSKDEKGKVDWQSFFGYQKGNKGLGSQLKVSSAYLILHKGQIAEGLNISKEMKAYQTYFDNLPNRQHVRINEKGVAVDKNLFDNEVVFKGTKFLFELELKANDEDGDKWNALLKELKSQKFRVGQGTRNGYGRLRVAEIAVKEFKFENKNDFENYLNLNPSLNSKDFKFEVNKSDNYGEDYTHYKLELKPDDFFIFNVGYGDDEADYMPITEQVISYDINGSIEKLKVKGETLIPATSIKGALSHRTAFHYNKNLST